MRVLRLLWRLLRALLLGLAALVVFIEEFGWRPLSAWLGRIAEWPPLHALEARIRRLPARPALGLFLVPAALLFPLKIAALGLLQAGHAATGVGIIVAAKVLGTAVAGPCSFCWSRSCASSPGSSGRLMGGTASRYGSASPCANRASGARCARSSGRVAAG